MVKIVQCQTCRIVFVFDENSMKYFDEIVFSSFSDVEYDIQLEVYSNNMYLSLDSSSIHRSMDVEDIWYHMDNNSCMLEQEQKIFSRNNFYSRSFEKKTRKYFFEMRSSTFGASSGKNVSIDLLTSLSSNVFLSTTNTERDRDVFLLRTSISFLDRF